MLNAAKITNKNFDGIADNSPFKINRIIPGTGIPIFSPNELFSKYSGNLVIFPWNLVAELSVEIRAKFQNYQSEIWVAIPELRKIK